MPASKATSTTKKASAPAKAVAAKKLAPKKASSKTAAKETPAKVATTKASASPATKAKIARPANTKSKKAADGNGATPITPEQRYRMICDAAYYRAERRGFIGGNPAEDWAAAEAEIDSLLLTMQH